MCRLNPYAKGELSLGAWFAGITEEELQEERNQILTAQPEDIQALGDLVEAVLKQRNTVSLEVNLHWRKTVKS